MRVVVLVDGEHHPPAVRAAIEEVQASGDEVVGAVFCGGAEKVDPARIDEAYGVPVVHGEDVADALAEALHRWGPGCVLDLTDEPILMPPDRFRLAAVTLASGATYRGADFELRPPAFEPVLSKPSVRVYATGKRTGKTAVASALARFAVERGHRPIIVAVGRGGPDPPLVIEAGTILDGPKLVELADSGLHAASDYIEDAMTSGVTTIGCRRVGGGLAGGMVTSNAPSAAGMADERGEDLVILEGSGASLPDVEAGTGIICIPADSGPDLVRGYLNPYRLLLADLAVVTMAEEASAAAEMEAAIRGTVPGLGVVCVAFRPEPLSQVSGRRVFFCCTAPPEAGPVLVEHLEKVYGCEVVGMTHRLADRLLLGSALRDAPSYDVLLTEIKGAAVDVAARSALEEGREVVFVNNALIGDDIDEAFARVLELAVERGPKP